MLNNDVVNYIIKFSFGNCNICKKKVNSVSEISEVTINKCYKKLEQLNMQLIPKKIIAKYINN